MFLIPYNCYVVQDDETNAAQFHYCWCKDTAVTSELLKKEHQKVGAGDCDAKTIVCNVSKAKKSAVTWTLLRWDRCSSTWLRSLDGTWKMVLWCSIIKVTSLVASSSSKSISSTEPRTQWENICTIWRESTGLKTIFQLHSTLHKHWS